VIIGTMSQFIRNCNFSTILRQALSQVIPSSSTNFQNHSTKLI
jgi:hypothetical protein